MRKNIMRKNIIAGLIAVAIALVLEGCGGGSTSTTTNQNPTALKQGTYLKTGLKSAIARPEAVSTMTPLPQTLIVEANGAFTFAQDNWNFIRGAMMILSDGSVKFSTDTFAIDPDGTPNTAPTINATYSTTTGVLSGTTSLGAFSVTMTDLQATTIDLNARAGTYISTDNTMGIVSVFTLVGPTSDNLFGYAYNSLADYQAGNDYIGTIDGTIAYTDSGASTHVNALNWGMRYLSKDGTYGSCTSIGYAYFDTLGNIVAVSGCNANAATALNSQFTGYWVKQ